MASKLGVDSPLLAIFNAHGSAPSIPVGVGDTNLTLKWNLRSEKPESASPALALSFAVETPTGNPNNQLGSGLADYGFNTVVQKHLSARTVLRINNGLILSGNTLTGVVGLKAQGIVYFAGASLTRDVSRTLLLGFELNGAAAQRADLGKAALQTQIGGKYAPRQIGYFRFWPARRTLHREPASRPSDRLVKGFLAVICRLKSGSD